MPLWRGKREWEGPATSVGKTVGLPSRQDGVAAELDERDVRRVEKLFRGMEAKLVKKLQRKAIRQAAKVVAEEAKRIVPVDTGALKRSIKVRALKRSRKNRGRVGARVVTGKGTFRGKTYYGGMVEYGTSRMMARPFMRTAARNKRADTRRVYIAAVKEFVRESGKR